MLAAQAIKKDKEENKEKIKREGPAKHIMKYVHCFGAGESFGELALADARKGRRGNRSMKNTKSRSETEMHINGTYECYFFFCEEQ